MISSYFYVLSKPPIFKCLFFLPAGLLGKSGILVPELSKPKLCSPPSSDSSMPASRPLEQRQRTTYADYVLRIQYTVKPLYVELCQKGSHKTLPKSISLLLTISIFWLLLSWWFLFFRFSLIGSPCSLLSPRSKLTSRDIALQQIDQ